MTQGLDRVNVAEREPKVVTGVRIVKKRILSLVVCMTLVFGMIPTNAVQVRAEVGEGKLPISEEVSVE